MGKQIFSFKGMMRDLSVSKNPSNYAYEIRNMRLTAQEDSTLLSLVTEKGNREFAIKDSYGDTVTLDNIIGYCTVGKYLTVFTHGETDSIVRLEEIKTATQSYMEAKILYQGDLNFEDSDGKVVEIDSLGCYENENIQKVYWVDGVNQPRLINITANDDEVSNWSNMETPFDFIPALGFNETVDIKKVNYNGLFAPGTLQYALTYYKRNGQQSNVFYTSPMYYTSHSNRGASPEDSVSNAFEIKVYNPDTSFDFIRVYSMLRTSQDDAPVCKRVYDIPLSEVGNEYVGRRYFIDESSSHSANWDTTGEKTYHRLSELVILQRNAASRYDALDINDFLYNVNGTEKQYLIPYGYYVLGNYDETENPTTKNVYVPADSSCGILIKHNLEPAVSDLPVKMANVTITNGVAVDYNDADMLYEPFTFAHYGVSEQVVTIIDNGLIGSSCSLEEIIYAGGQPIAPKTITQKSNTLFIGNYKLYGKTFTEDEKEFIKLNTDIYFGYSDTKVQKGNLGTFYSYKNQLDLSSKEITTFKGGEYYTFGLIFQDKYGQWSDVVPLDTVKNNLYPKDYDSYFYPVKAFIKLNDNILSTIESKEYVNIKAVVQDNYSTVICQGILSPTVFNYERHDGTTYAMSSWYFRDIEAYKPSCILTNNRPQARHYHNIRNNYSPIITDTTDNNATAENVFNVGEIQYASVYDYWFYTPNLLFNDYDMYVDWNVINMYGPDIEDGQYMKNLFSNSKIRIVGIIPLSSCVSSRNIVTASPAKWYDHSVIEGVNIQNNSLSTKGYELELSDYVYTDKNISGNAVKYPIYPWHRSISLHGQDSAEDDKWYSSLGTKIMASLRSSHKNIFLSNSDIKIFSYKNVYRYNKEDELPIGIELFNNNIGLYKGSVDIVLSTPEEKNNYCIIGSNTPSIDSNANIGTASAVPIRYKSNSHLVTQLYEPLTLPVLPNIYVDSTNEIELPEQDTTTFYNQTYLKVPLINIPSESITSGSLYLETGMVHKNWGDFTTYKKFYNTNVTAGFPFLSSNLMLEIDSTYLEYASLRVGDYVLVKNNSDIILCIVRQKTNSIKKLQAVDVNDILSDNGFTEDSDGNIIRILNPLRNFWSWGESLGNEPLISQTFNVLDGTTAENNVSWRFNGTQYKSKLNIKCYYTDASGTHLLTLKYSYTNYKYIAEKWKNGHWVNEGNQDWPYTYPDGEGMFIKSPLVVLIHNGYNVDNNISVGSSNIHVKPSTLTIPSEISDYAYMYLAEFYEDNRLERYKDEGSWLPCSEQYKISSSLIEANTSDTYYQRYDCLKTFPFTHEDQNQIIEILSFMCETKLNIDGRYDKYRGFSDNTVISEEKFNNINKAYTQKNNVFSYHYLDANLFLTDYFPNRVLWTKTKNPAEEIDSWTQIQTLSELDMDGIFGPISTLRLFNDNLLCWQSKGFARIQYNDRNAISTSSGVPVELANSGKVDGKTYISTEHGCDNMNTVQITPSGVYFTDSNTRDLMKYGQDGLFSLSKAKGFNSYMNSDVTDLKESKTFYDPKLQDIYFLNSHNSNIPQVFYFDEFGAADEYVVFDNKVLDLVINETGYSDEIIHTNIELYREGKGVVNGTLVNLWSEGYRQLNDNSNKAVYTGNIIKINNVEYCIYAIYNVTIYPETPNTAPVLLEEKIDENTPVYALVPKNYWKNYKTLKTCNNINETLITYYKFTGKNQYNGTNPQSIRFEYLIDVEDIAYKETLIFNEQLNEFTSFMDYDMDFLLHLQDSIVSIKGNSLHKQFDGDYLTFFGSVKDYSIEFIANENPLADKIFTNLEFRADVINPNTGSLVGTSSTTANSTNELPFSKIRVWNEYQDTGDTPLEQMIRRGVNMSQRFRIWRCDIPRDSTKKLDRIRNMWAKVKLFNTGKAFKTVLHDVNVIYYQ